MEAAMDDLDLQLEWLIDAYGPGRVLRALSDAFADRAEHIARTGYATMAKDYLALSIALETVKVPKGN
jgi:hypothetical protein